MLLLDLVMHSLYINVNLCKEKTGNYILTVYENVAIHSVLSKTFTGEQR